MRPRFLIEYAIYQYFIFFFFQAEDGIRDATVTGVQTCALPICPPAKESNHLALRMGRGLLGWRTGKAGERSLSAAHRSRSEERRVGKECRSRWSPDQ